MQEKIRKSIIDMLLCIYVLYKAVGKNPSLCTVHIY